MIEATVYNEDCIAGMHERLADESVHLTVTSIPFEELFTYSGKVEDVGNNGSTIDIRRGRFANNLRFVIDQLFRVTAAGCNVCIHIQQLLAYKNQHGFAGRRDFRGAVIDLFRAANFTFHGEVAIPKDPQAMAQRLSLHSLQFKTGHTRNSTNWAMAPNDYVLIFQKPGEIAVPVRPLVYKNGAKPLRREHVAPRDAMEYARYLREWGESVGATNAPKDGYAGGWLSSDDWVKWASGVWHDIDEFDVIDGARSARESTEEKHVCLARNSLVLTRSGYLPIQDVAIGDLVLTHLGRWRPVTAKACTGIKAVVQTEAQGVADLLTTPDHLLFTRRGAGAGRWPGMPGGSSHPRPIARANSPEWVRADETLGSYVNLKLPPVEESVLSAEDWWIIGRWLGDGHFDARGRAHISCAHREAAELIGSLGNRAGFTAVRETATQIALKDRCGQHSTEFTAMLKRCGRGAAGKRLPAEALALDVAKSESLLSGYLSADGHYVAKYRRWTASSVSRALVLGMAMVAQRARGVVGSVYAGRPGGTTTIGGRKVATRPDWILSIPPRNVSAMLLDDGAWKKVRQITPSGESEVWDLQIEEDGSFTAEGCIVHNCPLQLEVIRRCVLLYSNPIEIQPEVKVLDPFMGVGSTAAVCVELGRNSVGFELKESYHANALKNVERARAKVLSGSREAASLFEPAGKESAA